MSNNIKITDPNIIAAWKMWYGHKSNKEIWIEEQERIESQVDDAMEARAHNNHGEHKSL